MSVPVPLPPAEQNEVGPCSVSRVFKDSSGSHPGPDAHGHHPVRPVEARRCWLGESTRGRGPATKLCPEFWTCSSQTAHLSPHTGWQVLAGGQGAPPPGPQGKQGSRPCVVHSECAHIRFPLNYPSLPLPTALQFIEERDDLSSSSAAQWVPQGHCTPQRVHLLGGESELLHTVDSLEGGRASATVPSPTPAHAPRLQLGYPGPRHQGEKKTHLACKGLVDLKDVHVIHRQPWGQGEKT